MSRPLTMRRPRWRDAVVIITVVILSTYLLLRTEDNLQAFRVRSISYRLAYLDFDWSSGDGSSAHEIDRLVANAFNKHRSDLNKATNNLTAGAARYRERWGRHPPFGFDKWYAKALHSDAIVVEDFFDQIYEDLEPFWGVEPATVRNAIYGWEYTLSVRNGRVLDIPQGRHRSRTWGAMLQKLAPDLPDLDIAINPFDEPRVVVPVATLDLAYGTASKQKARAKSLPLSEFRQSLVALDDFDRKDASPEWIEDGSAWDLFRQGCRDDFPSESNSAFGEVFLRNWTDSKDICKTASLSKSHGGLINPDTLSMTQNLVPIFSAAKFSMNNDILLPAPSYYAEDKLFSVKSWFSDPSTRFPWTQKTNGLVWRGKATGGKMTEETWRRFQRQRFVSMMNASNVETTLAETQDLRGDLGRARPEELSGWLDENTDVAFTDLFCGGDRDAEDAMCEALNSTYHVADQVRMEDQYRWRYLPDVDGNTLSGRFRAFLQSNSAPLKATLVKEWHDSRLVPWIHFIPVNISFRDLWPLMAYFVGFGNDAAHADQGMRIALAGQEWSSRALRKDDMLLYMHRVLLEYARLCQDDRDQLGFVEDLINQPD